MKRVLFLLLHLALFLVSATAIENANQPADKVEQRENIAGDEKEVIAEDDKEAETAAKVEQRENIAGDEKEAVAEDDRDEKEVIAEDDEDEKEVSAEDDKDEKDEKEVSAEDDKDEKEAVAEDDKESGAADQRQNVTGDEQEVPAEHDKEPEAADDEEQRQNVTGDEKQKVPAEDDKDRRGDVPGMELDVLGGKPIIAYTPPTNAELKAAITECVKISSDCRNGPHGPIELWDVSTVTDLSHVFDGATEFNGDISTWDTSNVVTMHALFNGATEFNGDVSEWDVSKVTDMSRAFEDAENFDGDVSKWDVSKVTNMSRMFKGAKAFTGSGGQKALPRDEMLQIDDGCKALISRFLKQQLAGSAEETFDNALVPANCARAYAAAVQAAKRFHAARKAEQARNARNAQKPPTPRKSTVKRTTEKRQKKKKERVTVLPDGQLEFEGQAAMMEMMNLPETGSAECGCGVAGAHKLIRFICALNPDAQLKWTNDKVSILTEDSGTAIFPIGFSRRR